MMHGAPRTQETLSSYLARDHVRTESLLADAKHMVADGELERADDLIREVRVGLLRHIQLEEQIVFPLLERRGGRSSGPTVVMRHEHVRIQGELAEMSAALLREDRRAFAAACARLDALLPSHNLKEQTFLYPVLDGSLSHRERREVAQRLHAAG